MGVHARCKRRGGPEAKPMEGAHDVLRMPSVTRPVKRKKKKKRRSTPATRLCRKEDVSGHEVAQAQEYLKPWPFIPDEADHCETPLAAYRDLRPLLVILGKLLGKGVDELMVYDPYYCTGRVKEHLQSLGLTKVHNECEDFYKTAEENLVTDFDILVTNPPYTAKATPRRAGLFRNSVDHIERLLLFCRQSRKPAALLMPNFVYTRAYFDVLTVGQHVAFLAPVERYVYEAPREERLIGAGMSARDAHGHDRTKKTRTTAPFPSFWYLLSPKSASDTGSTPWWLRAGASSCHLHTLRDLPMHLRDGSDPRRRKRSFERNEPKRGKNGKLLCSVCGQEHGNCKHTRED